MDHGSPGHGVTFFLLAHISLQEDGLAQPPETGGNIKTPSPFSSTVSILLRKAMSWPLTINRIWGRTLVLSDSNKRDANSSPHLFTIVVRSSPRVLLSGTESSTSLLPRIFSSVRIVLTLTLINVEPSCLLVSVLRTGKETFPCQKIDSLSLKRERPRLHSKASHLRTLPAPVLLT